MIAIIDVQYYETSAKAVCFIIDSWEEEELLKELILLIDEIKPYIPGQFYLRELPCILAVLEKAKSFNLAYIIIDGHTVLDNEGKAGLGKILFEELNQSIKVIGVAKNAFAGNTKQVVEVLRGESKKPLYVSSLGMPKEEAAQLIQSMKGKYRMPERLKQVDTKTKEL